MAGVFIIISSKNTKDYIGTVEYLNTLIKNIKQYSYQCVLKIAVCRTEKSVLNSVR